MKAAALIASALAAIAPAVAEPARPVETLSDLTRAVGACWRAPPGLARFERLEQTIRFSLRRDGSVIGEPRVTFVALPPGRPRDLLAEAAVAAIRRCAPIALAPGFADRMAGRPISVHLIRSGPKGQGA